MTILCLQENLRTGLNAVSRAISSNSPNLETKNVLIMSDRGRLKIVATNLELAITVWIGAKVNDDTQINVPARMFSDFVNSLPDSQVEINLSDTGKIDIVCDNYTGQINTMSVSDFPPIPDVIQGTSIRLSAQKFRQVMGRIALAVSHDNLQRAILTGVKMEYSGESDLYVAAADGFRLATESIPVESNNDGNENEQRNTLDIVVPGSTINEVIRGIGDYIEDLSITVNEEVTQVLFKIGDSLEIVSTLLQGQYPKYRQLIPTKFNSSVQIDAKMLKDAIDSASVFAKNGNGIVRLGSLKNEADDVYNLKVIAVSEGQGESNIEIPINFDGQEDIKIAFNYRFLNDAVSSFNFADTMRFDLSSSSGPSVFRSDKNATFIHVLMPMSVNW